MHITNTGTSRKNDKSKAVFMGTKSHKKLFFLSFLSDPDPIIVHPIRKTSLFLRGSAGPCARRLLISSHTNNLVELTSRPFRKLIEWPLLTKIFNRTLTHKLGNMQNRDQREWVFEIREVKSENKKLSLFFEKCKVKKKCFHSFSRSAK